MIYAVYKSQVANGVLTSSTSLCTYFGGIACALFGFTMDWVEVSVTEWFERCAAGTKPPPDTVTFAPWRVPEQGHERGMYPAVVRNHTRRERPQR